MKKVPKPTTAQPEVTGEADYWREALERVNRMGEAARRLGLAVGRDVTPPPLNPDGSLKDPQGGDGWTPVRRGKKGGGR